MKTSKFPNTTSAARKASIDASLKSRLVRKGPRPMALEQRFMFDGAALIDAVETLDHNSPDTTALSTVEAVNTPLLLLEGAPAVVRASAQEAESLVKNYLDSHTNSELFALFNGGRTDMDADWVERLDSLRAALVDGSFQLNVVEMDSASQFTAVAAFTAEGPNGQPTVFVNSYWFGMFDSPDATRALVEELGHAIDKYLNPASDTAGDEGEAFADSVINGMVSAEAFALLNTQTDQGTVMVDGVSYDVEFASFNFSNAYQMITDLDGDNIVDNNENWAEKEQESHTLWISDTGTNANTFYGGLGPVSINDATNSSLFSGNDVSAIGINIGGTDYYGWISRPLKIQGSVVGFYFWTDQDFNNLSTAQADGNQDADSADAPSDPGVTDNKGFILVVNQSYFNSLIATKGTTKVTDTGSTWSAMAAGTYNSIEVGSSSDRVDNALNALVTSNAAPTATDDTATGTPDAGVAGRPALEQGYGVATVNATGNVLTNDVDANGDTLTVSKITSTTTANSVSPTGSSSFTVAGQYGTLTIFVDGRYSYEVNNNNSEVNALNVGDSLNDVFNYTANDGKGGTDTANLTIVIKGSNDAPVANPDYNIAKESTTVAGSGFNYSGYSATGNVLPNDSDVDDVYQSQPSDSTQPSGDFSVVGVSVTGAITGSTISVTPGTYTLSFSLSNGFSSVGSGDEIYVHLGVKTPTNGDIYTGLYTFDSGTGAYTLIYVQTKNTTNGTITFNATPTHYWDTVTNTFKSVGGLMLISTQM